MTLVATPITAAIGIDGDYKLCVIGQDSALNNQAQASATEHTWTKDTAAPVATISGGPTNPSNAALLNVTVGGIGVFTYQYKVVAQASACTGGGYNGSWIAVASCFIEYIGF